MRLLTLFILLATSLALAQNRNNNELAVQQHILDSLRREVEALKRIRLERANQLERAETLRWQNRYTQNRATQEYQSETRILEGRYTKTSDDISRAATELGSLRNLAVEQRERATAIRNNLENFHLLVNQAIERSTNEIPQDFPAKMEERLLNFANSPATIETFFQDRLQRFTLTNTQEFIAKDSYRLRLGTVFYARAEPGESSDVTAVLRTGALQGRVFEWRSSFPRELASEIRQAIFSAQQGANIAWVPIDVLQTKSVALASSGATEQTLWKRISEWFKAGGVVMYPLTLVALASLLIALERGFVLLRWGHISKTFTNKLHLLLQNNNIAEAKALCEKQKTCLGYLLGIILKNFEDGKGQAQKALQKALLSEQAQLEKRMNFLAALGSIAPLLGLLGTVIGMITLFNAITQAGTNDARILAGGISEALITTETGLIIAIPVMLIHGKLSETLDFITTELRVQSLSLFNVLWRFSP
ncbi:MAG: MotA/TolQ/ExbB proton channel family protein [Fibromonadaceae bacterium]|nr:MotA/TolQ/ExbB proton channel family protein [Fibromonadaceae bacterium]